MKRILGSLVFVLVAAFVLSACGGGGGGGSTPPPPPPPSWLGTLISRPAVSPIIAFTQSVVSKDTGTYNEVFPGCANLWALNEDLSLNNGFNLQFDYALALTVGSTSFPLTQTYSDLSFYTPYMGTAEGVKVAAVSDGKTVIRSLPSAVASVITGTAAFLNATSNSRLQQTLNLTSVPTGSNIVISWQDAVSLEPGLIPNGKTGYDVVIRKLDGTWLHSFLGSPVMTSGPGLRSYLVSHYTETVVLSFEVSSSTIPGLQQAYAIIDDVSVKPVGGAELIKNGDFEAVVTGNTISGWTTNTPAEVQNITSSSKNLAGLDVTRSFYTVPNKLWGRWVDVFANHTAATIATTVTYTTLPGVSGTRIMYDPVTLSTTPTSTMRALTLWDAAFQLTGDGTRDAGLVFGNANTVDFLTDDGSGAVGSGNPFITVTYNISVPAGGSIAIVNFVLMDGTDTGRSGILGSTPYLPANGSTWQATEIDAAAKDILTNFWNDTQYRTGMTQAQINAVHNF